MLNRKFLTSTSLKIIAITAMFIDHFAASGVYGLLSGNFNNPYYYNEPMYIILRTIGRLTFPIFAFFIAEGFYNTRSRYRYLFRLAVFAFISEIPFDLAFNVKLPMASFWSIFDFADQNIFFTLALGLLAIIAFDFFKNKEGIFKRTIGFLLVLAIGYLANILKTDYGLLGVLMIFSFYYFRGNFVGVSISISAINVLMVNMAVYYVLIGRNLPFINFVQLFGVLPLILIYFYNNQKGFNLKYFFYWFYPVHLSVLFCIKYLLF